MVETSHDADGIVWPSVLAPYKATVLTFSRDAPAALEEEAQDVAAQLTALPGFEGEVVYDDRAELQPGAKMKEAQLLGFPWMLILGRRWLAEGLVEVEERRGGKKAFVKRAELADYFAEAAQRL